MNPTPQDTGATDGYILGGLAAVAAILVALLKRADPRMILAFLNEPTVRPINERLDRMEAKVDKACRVIDHMPHAPEAHAAVKAEEERWET